MKLAFVSSMNGSPWGGSEILWSETVQYLSKHGYQVRVACAKWPQTPQPIKELVQDNRINVWEYSSNSISNKKLSKRIIDKILFRTTVNEKRKWLRESSIDLLCISSGHATEGAYWMQLAKEEGIPYVTIAHACAEFLWPVDKEADYLIPLFESAVKCYFVSQGNKNLLQTQLGFEFKNAEIIPNHSAKLWNQEIPWPHKNDDIWRLACVGRLNPIAKGQDILIETLKEKRWKNRPVKVSIYGEGAQENILRRLVKNYELEDKIEFCGQVDGLKNIWAENHALVLPSRFEGLPLVLIEAMMCKRTAIVTDIAGNKEILENKVSGFIAEAPTILHFGRSLEEAWTLRDQWRDMGEAAYTEIRKKIPPDPAEVLANKMISLAKLQRF